MNEGREHLDCIDFVGVVTDYLERQLKGEEVSLVEEHLNLCDGCGRYLDQMRQTVRLAGLLRQDEVAEAIRPAVLAAFRNWKRQ
jgi:predicted anti-sigma-YlaC factor YlaD